MADAAAPLYTKIRRKTRTEASTVEVLVRQGFPEHQVYKALAATGWSSVQAAALWLQGHWHDPSLDDPIPQEYILYLLPSGPLAASLQDFQVESLRLCGKNRAHGRFPHVTLSDFFTCEDEKVGCLYAALKASGERTAFPQTVSLSLYSSSSFIGFFLNKEAADVIRSFMESFCQEVSSLTDCPVKPLSREFHLTLAHKFSPHHQATLERLAKSISATQGCVWEAAIFSRDMRFVHYQTFRALFPFEPQNDDELKLCVGDMVFVDTTGVSDGPEGWLMATSHRTGCWGLVPENYLNNEAETITWIKQRSFRFGPDESKSEDKDTKSPNIPQLRKNITEELPVPKSLTQVETRRVLLVKHAESLDEVFGHHWLKDHALVNGVYYRPDLNFPVKLPHRDTAEDLEGDPPLSSCGVFQARLLGEALRDGSFIFSSVFCFPNLRCIQTAQQILRGMQMEQQVKICVDQSQHPKCMTLNELEQNGLNVEAMDRVSSLRTESNVWKRILKSLGSQKGPENDGRTSRLILVVAPSSSIILLSRMILGDLIPESEGAAQVPALASCLCEEVTAGRWVLRDSPVKGPTHSSNTSVRWDDLIYNHS
ncbi:ubiquitin-associated and SH3 domain-containing protein A isoform X2 [Bufo bufo]|uniref:ubiquitin-associated and SH3 domain-containing protein A isoform X2 n=1 Tax=Bufo bufo TaxID=8384 RepID=UPI001ABEABBB|nr:ubiquitin-associated and SH3 domain-containing protein A isoform X2 [Bufo bufo]